MADSGDRTEWHTVENGATQFTLPKRYQNLSPFEYDAFSIIAQATDTVCMMHRNTGKKVIIRKMSKPFNNGAFAHRTYRELKLRIHLNHYDAQIAQLYDIFTPEKDLNSFETLYLVHNYVDYDLRRVISSSTVITENHIKLIIYSLLLGLKFIHSAGVIHRRLNSSHVGICTNSDISILGWDSVAATDLREPYDEEWTYYESGMSRWWYAPEMIINRENCNAKVDIWSVGCIMAELILRKPLFCGRDQIDQLTKIFEIVGTPDSKTLDEITPPGVRQYIRTLAPKPKQDYETLFGYKYNQDSGEPVSGVSSNGIALLDRLLSFNYCTRPTAEEALNDPYFELFHDPMEEPSTEPLIDEHRGATYSIEKWKSIIWDMIKGFVPPPWISENLDGNP